MTEWEHTRVSAGETEVDRVLEDWGRGSWELVSAVHAPGRTRTSTDANGEEYTLFSSPGHWELFFKRPMRLEPGSR
jgi:hypothetical protein